MYPFALWDAPTPSYQLASRRSALRSARRGDARSIATLMNYSLRTRGITARANFQEDGLWIMLEGNPVPRQKDMVRFVYGGVSRLNIPDLKVVRLYGMRSGQMTPAWSQDIRLDEPYNDALEEPYGDGVGIPPLQVDESAQSLQQIYSKLNPTLNPDRGADPHRISLGSLDPQYLPKASQRFANYSLSEVLGNTGGVKRDRPMSVTAGVETVTHGQRLRLTFPLAEPVPSQQRLMTLLKIFTAITILVAAGSLLQVIIPLRGLPGADDPFMFRVVSSAALLSMAIAAWVALGRREGINLHPRYAQQSYIRLAIAFMVNVSSALLLLILFGLGILTPSSSIILPLFALCVGLWMMGCSSLCKAKGYHPIWGLAGILLLDGAVLLSIFPDRRLPHCKVVTEMPSSVQLELEENSRKRSS